ncbi:hypothetical protein HBI51_111200 [Parastagonospora nodorum]|nr:hypothetical protein HBI51_111200 [Parastagonospora nodorum]
MEYSSKTLSEAPPSLIKRDPSLDPSPYPYGTELSNEMRWKGWDMPGTIADRTDGKQLHDAYLEMETLAVYAWQEADAKTPTFKRWFAEADSENVKKVSERMVDPKALVPDTLPRMKDRVLWRKDFLDACDDGKTYAYTKNKSGRFKFCDKGLRLKDITTIKCEDLAGSGSDRYSSKKIMSVASTHLHEAVHWNKIGKTALGQEIVDKAYGAAKSHRLSAADQLINADNYAFMASEAYLQKKGCTFVDPPVSATDEDDDRQPDSFDGDVSAISIILRTNVRETFADNDWYVYEIPVGVSALCKPEDQTVTKWTAEDGPWPSNGPDWPAGTFDINVDGMECQYKNDGRGNPGSLWCKGQDDPFTCYKDPKLDKREGKFCDGGRIYQQPYVYCQW